MPLRVGIAAQGVNEAWKQAPNSGLEKYVGAYAQASSSGMELICRLLTDLQEEFADSGKISTCLPLNFDQL